MRAEKKMYEPNQDIVANAYISGINQYQELYKKSIENPQGFWAPIAKQFHWETPADPANYLQYNFDITKGPISIKWMEGASTNISYNLLDRHIRNGHGNDIAYYW